MTEQEEPATNIEESLPAQVLRRALSNLEQNPVFDAPCVARLRAIIEDGGIARADRVIETLQEP